jgi:predicted nucleotidyltransferase
MSLAQTFQAKAVPLDFARSLADEVAGKIRSVSDPMRIILFGSAVDGNFREGSDLDILLIFETLNQLQLSRKKIRQAGKLCDFTTVDLIFVTLENYNNKKDLGGICFVAEHEGSDL